MTDEVAEKNNVVAAACCKWCSYYEGYPISLEGRCSKLKEITWASDICDHFKQGGDSMKKTDKDEKYVGTVTVSIPKDMFEKLQKKAKEDFRDLNMEILYAIDKMLNGVTTISYTPVWTTTPNWVDKNTTPSEISGQKNWDGSPVITC